MSQGNQNNNKGSLADFYLDKSLQDDTNMQEILKTFNSSIDVLEADMEKALALRAGHTLTTNEQIKLDSYLAYLNSTLYWIHLKLQGVDVSKHGVMHDLGRAKELLARDKEINESLAAPRLDMPAANRFIAAGIHTRFVDMDGVMVTEKQYNKSLQKNDQK
ncbi:nuclear nucleic acid-binding protein C1D [Drosophila eugracilis]|uniref:nuclear nucleic acid-binding protein C1D n=1 Tax=Drosophila eugracilis TaxID=29029 RepID=UPI0007E659FF|nr:nuclear nucleic acid-binding protein C1D [Drosophila eugracilis]